MGEIYRAMRPDESEAVMRLWLSVFPDANRGILRSFLETDPWRNPEYGRVCEVDGELVSIAYLGRRPVNTPWGTRIMGGIGYVGTLEAYRGRGINTKVMLDAIRVMEEESMDFSMLITPINPYYERLGYETVPRVRMLVTPPWDGWHPGTSVASITDTMPPIPDLLEVYSAYNDGRAISVQRDEGYWKGWCQVRFEGARWIHVREGGKLLGYAVVRALEDRIQSPEIGWLPERQIGRAHV